jgi:hypothetical protein
MANPNPAVTDLPRRLPESVRIARDWTPNELRSLKVETGRALSDLIGGDENDMDKAPDRIQSLVWIALRRAGYDCSWDEAGDVRPDMTEDTPDPTKPGSSSSSSSSAGSGA